MARYGAFRRISQEALASPAKEERGKGRGEGGHQDVWPCTGYKGHGNAVSDAHPITLTPTGHADPLPPCQSVLPGVEAYGALGTKPLATL